MARCKRLASRRHGGCTPTNPGVWVAAALLRLAVTSLRGVEARFFLARMPNADRVPCVDGEAGCHGQPTCESFGHYDCFPFKPINAFGYMYKLDPTGLWDVNKCSQDSDGDGWTNGDELGDPCCEWQFGDTPRVTSGITNPARNQSIPARPSCSDPAAAVVPTTLLLESTSSAVRASWGAPGGCACEYIVEITYMAAGTSANTTVVVGSIGRTFVLCNVEADTDVFMRVVSLNRATASAATPWLSTRTLGPGVSPTLPNGWSCSPTQPSPVSMNTAGHIRLVQVPIEQGVGWASIAWSGILGLGILLAMCNRDPVSTWRRRLLHTPLSNLPKNRFLHWLCWDLASSSPAFVAVYVGCVASIAVTMYVAWLWFDRELFAWGQGFPVDRAAGYALTICLALQLLPVTRWSIWLHIFGVPFERALRLHRWLGLPTFVLTVWHGAAMIIKFNSTKLGWQYTFNWLPLDAINPLPGALAGIIIVVITLCSLEPIRRRCYEITVLAHMLWPACIAFSCIHTVGSKGSALPLLLPGTLLLSIDFGVMAADWLLRPVKVIAAGIVSDRPTDLMWHRTAYLVCEKRGIWSWVDRVWPFRYACGQYVYLCLPAVSAFPHPFSISSPPDPLYPCRFTVHVKAMGAGTWSDAVVSLILASTSDQHRIPSPPGSARPQIPSLNTLLPQMLPSSAAATAPNASGDRLSRVRTAGTHIGSVNTTPNSSQRNIGLQPASTDTAESEPSTGRVVYAVPAAGAHIEWAVPDAQLPTVLVTGPFGRPSVHLQHYRHFVLVAGGIGITAIAPLHYCLARGYPIAPIPSVIETIAHGYHRHGSGVSICDMLLGRKPAKSLLSRVTAKAISLTTVWTTRDRSLIEAFAPQLGAEQRQDSVAPQTLATSATPLRPPSPAKPLLSPRSVGVPNPLALGQRLAQANKWQSSFAIVSKMMVETRASHCSVQMKVYLTSGKKRANGTATARTDPPPGGSVTQQAMAAPEVARPRSQSPGLSPGNSFKRSTSPVTVERSSSLLDLVGLRSRSNSRTAGAVGSAGETVNVAADSLDATTAAILQAANAVANVPLPIVNRDRPNIPQVLNDVAEAVYATHGPGPSLLLRAQSFDRHTQRPRRSATTARVFRWIRSIWAAVSAFFTCAFCRRSVLSARAGLGNENMHSSPYSSAVDDHGRVAVAVVVCGPHEMVLTTIDSCKRLNAGPLGARVVFHVHHEEFLM